MGLISGTYSTMLITLGAPWVGRSRAVDWMDIGTVLLGLDGLRADPAIREIAAGLSSTRALIWNAFGRRAAMGHAARFSHSCVHTTAARLR